MAFVSGASMETVFLTVDREMGTAEFTGAGAVDVADAVAVAVAVTVAVAVAAAVAVATGIETGEANVKDGASVGRVAVDKASSLYLKGKRRGKYYQNDC